MCEPVTTGLLIASAVASVAAAGTAAYGQVQQGKYQQEIADQNAKYQEDSAALALQRGSYEAGVSRMQTSQQIAEARAAGGGSGIEMTNGSALDAISDARMLNELDVQTIKNNAAREAWGYKVGATATRAQGELDRMSSRYGAASTLLGGAAQAASLAYGFKKPTTSGALAPSGGGH
jgi:hypothetical protein